MLFNTRGNVPDRLADVTGIAARMCKHVNHTWTELDSKRVFHTKQVAGYLNRKTLITIALYEMGRETILFQVIRETL